MRAVASLLVLTLLLSACTSTRTIVVRSHPVRLEHPQEQEIGCLVPLDTQDAIGNGRPQAVDRRTEFTCPVFQVRLEQSGPGDGPSTSPCGPVTGQYDPGNETSLKPGDMARVWHANRAEGFRTAVHVGQFVGVRSDTLFFSNLQIDLASVERVQIRSGRKRGGLGGFVAGLLIGSGAAALLTYAFVEGWFYGVCLDCRAGEKPVVAGAVGGLLLGSIFGVSQTDQWRDARLPRGADETLVAPELRN